MTLLNTDIGLYSRDSTGSSGEYSFSPVRIGNYSITVTAAGFSTTTQQHLVVTVSQRLQVNVELKPGSATKRLK